MISEMRKSHQLRVVHGIESFSKRTTLRNVSDVTKLDKEDLSMLYDRFNSIQFYATSSTSNPAPEKSAKSSSNKSPTSDSIDRPKLEANKMDIELFRAFLSDISDWTLPRPQTSPSNTASTVSFSNGGGGATNFIRHLFRFFDRKQLGYVKFEDIAIGMGEIVHTDMMGRIEWLFRLYDGDGDGWLVNDEIIQLSETFLFLLHLHPESTVPDEVLKSVSSFLNMSFEFCEQIQASDAAVDPPVHDPVPISQSYSSLKSKSALALILEAQRRLSLGAFRAVILADLLLETFLDTGLSRTLIANLHSPNGFHTQEMHSNNRKQIFDQLWNNARQYVSSKTKTLQVRLKKSEPTSPTSTEAQLILLTPLVSPLDGNAAFTEDEEDEKLESGDVLKEVDRLLLDIGLIAPNESKDQVSSSPG